MIAEEIIEQILLKHPKLCRNQILGNLEKERKKTGGLISDEALLRLIAARFGVEIVQPIIIRKPTISQLVAGLHDVTIAGRVIVVYPPRAFNGERSGKVANLMIADKDSTLRVVLWNDKVDLVESGVLKTGQVISFFHGYTRNDYEGKLELHLGSKSSIEVEPANVKADDYLTFVKLATKINEIAKESSTTHLVGRVKEIFPASTFMRSDMSTGVIMRFTLADETGEIPVVVWNEKAKELENLKVNTNLQLVNAKVKGNGSELEVHINSYTHVEVSEILDS